MHPDAAKFRHDLRNLTHSFRLTMAAMELEKNEWQKIEWLDAIISTAERGIRIIDEHTPGEGAEGELP